MKDKTILREAMQRSGLTQAKLGERIGMKQNALSANMTRDRMSLDNFRKVLGGMDYDVAVVDRKTNEVVWIVTDD